jgi:hypothetical protein
LTVLVITNVTLYVMIYEISGDIKQKNNLS